MQKLSRARVSQFLYESINKEGGGGFEEIILLGRWLQYWHIALSLQVCFEIGIYPEDLTSWPTLSSCRKCSILSADETVLVDVFPSFRLSWRLSVRRTSSFSPPTLGQSKNLIKSWIVSGSSEELLPSTLPTCLNHNLNQKGQKFEQ